MTPVPGCIGVQRNASLVGLAIQFGTRSRWNHAGILEDVFPDGTGAVLEAQPGGFRRTIVQLSDWSFDPLDLPLASRIAIVEFARQCMGLPYDWSDIASFVWRFNRVKIFDAPYPDHPDDRVICSEAAAWAFRMGTGLDPWPGIAANEISPGDVEQALWHPTLPELVYRHV